MTREIIQSWRQIPFDKKIYCIDRRNENILKESKESFMHNTKINSLA